MTTIEKLREAIADSGRQFINSKLGDSGFSTGRAAASLKISNRVLRLRHW